MRIGIDIGGTKIVAGLVDESGTVLRRKKIATEAEKGYEGVRDNIIGLIRAIIEGAAVERSVDSHRQAHGTITDMSASTHVSRLGPPLAPIAQGNLPCEHGEHEGEAPTALPEEGATRAPEIERIGIASAGQIDRKTKNILFSPNLGWRDVPLKDDIESACGITTSVENDVNAATYGEWRFGLKGEPRDVIGVFVGTGIGGGLIINRKLYRGAANVGGEVGHMILNPYGYKCRCGNLGCFEAYCGGSHVVERVKTEINGGYRGKIWDIIEGDPGMLHTGHIEEAYLSGDALCRRVWKEVIEYMGVALASLVNLLNPEIIILGGGVVYGSRHLVEDAESAMECKAMQASLKGLRVEKAMLREDAGIVGAAFADE